MLKQRTLKLALLGASMFLAPADAIAQSAPATLSDSEVSARADALIARMTPEEKAGQLSQFFHFAPIPAIVTHVEQSVAAGKVGSVLFVNDPATANRLQRLAFEKSRLKIPLLFGFDVIHGLRTIMPVPLGVAASWDPALAEKAQSVAAAEARASGIHWVFAPMVDIARDARWGRIVEGAGEDPFLGAAMAAAQVRGFQGDRLGLAGRVIAGPKHFAGYGAPAGGRDYEEVQLSDSDLWNVYLPPFKAAIDAGAGNIMSAYMSLNGVPAAGNKWLLTRVLRDSWGFKGFVVSDAAAVASLTAQGFAADSADAAVRAVDAGLDMEMAVPGRPAAMEALPGAVAAGRLSQKQVDDAVRRILSTKIRMGLFEKPYVDEKRAPAVLADPAHLEVARVGAERSAVLLRNEGSLLPLDRSKIRSVAVIGPMADSEKDTLGPWVIPQSNARATTVLAGLKEKLGPSVRVEHALGVQMPERVIPNPGAAYFTSRPKPAPVDDSAEIARAVALARGADVAVLVLGEGMEMIGEAASRSSFDLPGRQQELLDAVVAAGKPVVVLLFNGRPMDLKDSKAPAVLEMWYPGSAGGQAAANLLFGDAVPGGKLPITWPRSASQAPMTYLHLASHDPESFEKHYWNEASSGPVYPFGYGLSYTSFAYSNLRMSKPAFMPGEPVTLSVDVTNTGKRTGDEVAQLYIHQRAGTSARPVRELKGFERLTLQPGEARTLRFTIKPEDLRYWSAVTRDWVAEPADFDVWAGGDSRAALAASFKIARP